MLVEIEQRRRELYALLGDLPPRDRAISATPATRAERAGYFLETLALDLNGIEIVPAYLVKQKNATRAPALICNHAHGGDYVLGKEELLAGRKSLQSPPYADALTSSTQCIWSSWHTLVGHYIINSQYRKTHFLTKAGSHANCLYPIKERAAHENPKSIIPHHADNLSM